MQIRVVKIALWALSLGVFGACGGTQGTQPEMPDLPPRVTTGTFVGPLCSDNKCRCKSADSDAGAPESTVVKRFEFKLGPTEGELWVKVGDMVLYKSKARATECFYLDLASPGEYRVTLRSTNDKGGGTAARLAISEMRTEGTNWYNTFEFACGGPGVCNKAQLRDFKESLNKYKRNIHDPCSSTKILGLSWDTGRMPDAQHPQDVYVELRLRVYKFVPEFPSGHASCVNNL